ncbi:MAG TPA: rhodanese-like domain-containing protein, partial [Gemmatimonadaceae bacterium]|nr:rhodanese-like domain-containing protein [Gemmatimonadaceae bacterium]
VWTVAVLLTAAWVGAEMLARRVERRGVPWWRPTTMESVALALAVAYGATGSSSILPSARVAAIARQIAREEDHVDPLDLAQAIRERRAGLRIIDVREGLDTETYMIPGAEAVPLDRLAKLEVRPGEHVVLYSDGGAHAAQGWVLLRARGLADVKVLKDGMAAWEDEVMTPAPPLVASDTGTRRFAQARELAHWFGGRPQLVPVANGGAGAGAAGAPHKRRRKTC